MQHHQAHNKETGHNCYLTMEKYRLCQICCRVHSRFLSQIQHLSQYALLDTRVKTLSAMGVQMGKMIMRQCGERTLQMRVGCEVNKETLSDIKLEGQVESSWGGKIKGLSLEHSTIPRQWLL